MSSGLDSSVTIESISSSVGLRSLPQLIELMRDAVDHGASIGFLPPLTDSQAASFWDGVLKEISSGRRIVLVARKDGEIVGSVQLLLADRENAPHRAEVQKLFVHTSHRGNGYARSLMVAIEEEAKRVWRRLLVLDTNSGSAAEKLYHSLGYQFVGSVPEYSLQADRTYAATSIFCKLLG
ncbi:MAG: GNAT family N-acetyltransferase [Fimbriimonas sp.]